mmetsp:Transcript_14800/g.58051  ORF Transcript_14800/g.58051 Transcript_14800/m.58051 type:complete len:210 (+) Transcript_14800:2979-3608(+)
MFSLFSSSRIALHPLAATAGRSSCDDVVDRPRRCAGGVEGRCSASARAASTAALTPVAEPSRLEERCLVRTGPVLGETVVDFEVGLASGASGEPRRTGGGVSAYELSRRSCDTAEAAFGESVALPGAPPVFLLPSSLLLVWAVSSASLETGERGDPTLVVGAPSASAGSPPACAPPCSSLAFSPSSLCCCSAALGSAGLLGCLAIGASC